MENTITPHASTSKALKDCNSPQALFRQSSDIAGLCKEIVLKYSQEIGGRKYVSVEGWKAIATAHGCVASSRYVQKTDNGYSAIGDVTRILDGAIISTSDGFVGKDETTWFEESCRPGKELPAMDECACRVLAQTRAISRACRSAFAHVVALMDANIDATPQPWEKRSWNDYPKTTATIL